MAQYKWHIDKVATLNFFGGQYNVVSRVEWHMSAENVPFKTDYYGATDLPLDDLTYFKPYNQVTNDDIIGWLNTLVDVPWVQSCLDLQLQQMQTPSATTISR